MGNICPCKYKFNNRNTLNQNKRLKIDNIYSNHQNNKLRRMENKIESIEDKIETNFEVLFLNMKIEIEPIEPNNKINNILN